MSISYDVFTDAFLSKITEFELLELDYDQRDELVDGYMKRALSEFGRICKYDLTSNMDDEHREFGIDIAPRDLDEVVDIISEGMVMNWLKPYLFRQEILENQLNTRDFTTYSPAELQNRVRETYKKAQDDFTQKMREYSYNHNDLTRLHL